MIGLVSRRDGADMDKEGCIKKYRQISEQRQPFVAGRPQFRQDLDAAAILKKKD
jgi:hypothetical protein